MTDKSSGLLSNAVLSSNFQIKKVLVMLLLLIYLQNLSYHFSLIYFRLHYDGLFLSDIADWILCLLDEYDAQNS